MIEINLLPDVKLELVKARRAQTMIITGSILTTIVSAGIVTLLAVYVFPIQFAQSVSLDNNIKKGYEDLQSIDDLSKILTIQNQLNQIKTGHDGKLISSRIFSLLDTINPKGKNAIGISRVELNKEENTLTLDAEAKNQYEALEVFKKTLAATNFIYYTDAEEEDPIIVPVASAISDSDRSSGQSNSSGDDVLRFTVSFTYAPEMFERTSLDSSFKGPEKQNVTDSVKGVPKSLFTDGVVTDEDTEGEQ